MRSLLLVLASASVLLTLACVHQAEVVVPPTGPSTQITAKFAPPDAPKASQLFVCGLVDGEFWCVDYKVFEQELDAKSGDPSTKL